MTPLETLVLVDGRSRVTLAPSRGGMVTRFSVDGRPVLFLDEATLVDTTKNVRGGNPVLFPSPGPLTDQRFQRGGRSGSMKQHGLARLRPWAVTESGATSATLVLRSDEGTRGEFPWEFELTHRHVLQGAKLTIEQRIRNLDRDPMPFAMGFHPYFWVPDVDKAKAAIPTDASRAWDNVARRHVAVRGTVPLVGPEVDIHLEDHRAHHAELRLPDGATIVVSASEAYRRWIVWTQAGKDFVCLEPWTAPGDALNTGEGLLEVPPGGSMDLFVSIFLRSE